MFVCLYVCLGFVHHSFYMFFFSNAGYMYVVVEWAMFTQGLKIHHKEEFHRFWEQDLRGASMGPTGSMGGGGWWAGDCSIDRGYKIKYYSYCMISNVFLFRDCWSPQKVGRNLTCNSNIRSNAGWRGIEGIIPFAMEINWLIEDSSHRGSVDRAVILRSFMRCNFVPLSAVRSLPPQPPPQ